jgi:hypothetical protein
LPKGYPTLDWLVLEIICREASKGPVPMRQIVQTVKRIYGEESPSKVTVWRAVRRLEVQGLLKIQRRKVIREFTEYLLSPAAWKISNLEELLAPRIRGSQLRIAMKVRQAVEDLTRNLASSYKPPKPEKVLAARTEGELAALVRLARKNFNRFFRRKNERTYCLKRFR